MGSNPKQRGHNPNPQLNYLQMPSRTEMDLLEVLERLGESSLVSTYETVLDEIGTMFDPKFSLGWDSDSYATITFVGLCELEDGRITDRKTSSSRRPTEKVASEEDIVPAAKRLLERIFRHLPRLRTRVRMLLEIRGFDAGWI